MTDQQPTTPAPQPASAPVGLGSKLGVGSAALALTIPGIAELADAAEPLGVPPEVWVQTSAVLVCLVIVGRYAQAVVDRWRQG